MLVYEFIVVMLALAPLLFAKTLFEGYFSEVYCYCIWLLPVLSSVGGLKSIIGLESFKLNASSTLSLVSTLTF